MWIVLELSIEHSSRYFKLVRIEKVLTRTVESRISLYEGTQRMQARLGTGVRQVVRIARLSGIDLCLENAETTRCINPTDP